MRNIMWMIVLLCVTVPLLAKDAPLTPDTARASAGDAVDFLVQLNEEVADHYFHSGEWEKAVAAFECVIALQPKGLDAYANAAWLLWSSGQDARAMDFYHRMVAANPTDPEGYFIVGEMFFGRKRYAEALPWVEKAVALGLTSPHRHLLGHTLLKVGRRADALAFWQRLLAEDPKDDVARRQIDDLQKNSPPAPAAAAPAKSAPAGTP